MDHLYKTGNYKWLITVYWSLIARHCLSRKLSYRLLVLGSVRLLLITRLVYEKNLSYVLKPWCTIYTFLHREYIQDEYHLSHINNTCMYIKYGKCQIHTKRLCMVLLYSPPRKCRPSENHMMNPWGQLAIYQLLCCNVDTGDFTKLVMPVYTWAWTTKTKKKTKKKNQHTHPHTPAMIFTDMCFLDVKYICLIVAYYLTTRALQFSIFGSPEHCLNDATVWMKDWNASSLGAPNRATINSECQ